MHSSHFKLRAYRKQTNLALLVTTPQSSQEGDNKRDSTFVHQHDNSSQETKARPEVRRPSEPKTASGSPAAREYFENLRPSEVNLAVGEKQKIK